MQLLHNIYEWVKFPCNTAGTTRKILIVDVHKSKSTYGNAYFKIVCSVTQKAEFKSLRAKTLLKRTLSQDGMGLFCIWKDRSIGLNTSRAGF